MNDENEKDKTPSSVSGEITVFNVIDGDTISVISDANTKPMRIRFACIDAPEMSQSWGIQAKAFLK